jgi:pimeloyl-ACP methyl ester carboxylesterase
MDMSRWFGLAVALLSLTATTTARAADQEVQIGQGDQTLHGALLRPQKLQTGVAVLMLPGSGPSDRNDDELPTIAAHSLKLLAEGLAADGVISLRIDKRGAGASAPASPPEQDLRFQMYVDDVVNWVRFLRTQADVRCVVILGHSEGALVAILAAQQVETCGVVSVSGPGRNLGDIVEDQYRDGGASAAAIAVIHKIVLSLRSGQAVADVPPALMNVFRPSVQPYWMSQLNLDPPAELAKVKAPVLIIQGDNDLQIKVQDARRLAAAQPRAELVILHGMNHMLKLAPADLEGNLATYANPDLPLAPGLVPTVAAFAKKARARRPR